MESNTTHPTTVSSFSGPLLSFYQSHGVQFIKCGLPISLISPLFTKLTTNTYDVGSSFTIVDDQDNQTFHVQALHDMKKEGDIWVLDHLLTFRYTELRGKLEGNEEMVKVLEEMTKYLGGKRKLGGGGEKSTVDLLRVEFDSQELSTVQSLQIPTSTVCLSLCDNNLANAQQIIFLIKSLPHLKVLWLNGNPVAEDPVLDKFIQGQKAIELFNSKLTGNATEWIIKYLKGGSVKKAGELENEKVEVLDLEGREVWNVNGEVLRKFKNLHAIRLTQTAILEESHISKLENLLTLPSLRSITCDYPLQLQIFSLYRSTSPSPISSSLLINDHNLFKPIPTLTQTAIDILHPKIFKLSNCYRLADDNRYDETSVWYVNDELGSAITHSDLPQCKLAPFLYAPNGKMDGEVRAYTLMWLEKDVKEGSVVERDYLNGIGEEKGRSSRLAVWYDLPKEIYMKVYEEYNKNLEKIAQEAKIKAQQPVELNKFVPTIKEKYKVATDYPFLKQYLTLPEFEFVNEISEADIIWTNASTKENEDVAKLVEKGVITNQFKHEICITTKNALANTIQSTLGNTLFLQRTYDLATELPIFLGHFFSNQSKGLDNLWISKPPNMARSMDMIVTNSLQTIIRNMQTGPKLVQKYITNPVKRLNRKIDIRFIVAVKSISPLNIYLYRHFWIRTSNNQYSTDCRYRQQYQTHFTVMNYGQVLTRVNYPDFIQEFNKDYFKTSWDIVYQKIKQMVRQTFIAVQKKYPEIQDSRSRAYYGVDVMVDEENMEPKLLEFTFSPDCERACKYYPTFYNDLFEVLFLERENKNVVPLFGEGK